MNAANHSASGDPAATTRKLAAILHADVAGFSRLMGTNEAGTHARLIAYRKVIDETMRRHGGRIVGTAGDAILADFPSVVTALSAAVDVQAALAVRNAEVAANDRLEFRIGINLGDVIVDGNDIFGDGVNVAARIQALADPGGIAVSAAVYDQVRGRQEFGFREAGTHRLKNITEPVKVYVVDLSSKAISDPASAKRPGRRAVMVALVLVSAVVAIGGLKSILAPIDVSLKRSENREDPRNESQYPIQKGKPTIAVLPFESMSPGVAHQYFEDGMTEDVITDLSRFSNLLVLSWNAVAPYRDQNVAPEQLSRDLDVRYVVGGTVRRAGERLRVTVQLTDAGRGVLLWSERYDEDLVDVFAVQDRIARQVVRALAVRLNELEQKRAFAKPTEHLDAYEHVLRARDLLRRVERGANLDARAQFRTATEIDPRYADAYVGLGWTHMNDFLWGWTEWPHRAIEQAQDLATRAIALDDRNASAHALLANALRFRQDRAQAQVAVKRAIELNPNNALSLAIYGTLLVESGRPEAAVPVLELALRLDPNPIAWSVVNLALAYYLLDRNEDVIRLLEPYEGRFIEDPAPFALLAAAYGQMGRADAAAAALAGLRRVSPFFDAGTYASYLDDPEHARHLIDGLRKAGLEVQADAPSPPGSGHGR